MEAAAAGFATGARAAAAARPFGLDLQAAAGGVRRPRRAIPMPAAGPHGGHLPFATAPSTLYAAYGGRRVYAQGESNGAPSESDRNGHKEPRTVDELMEAYPRCTSFFKLVTVVLCLGLCFLSAKGDPRAALMVTTSKDAAEVMGDSVISLEPEERRYKDCKLQYLGKERCDRAINELACDALPCKMKQAPARLRLHGATHREGVDRGGARRRKQHAVCAGAAAATCSGTAAGRDCGLRLTRRQQRGLQRQRGGGMTDAACPESKEATREELPLQVSIGAERSDV
uniref:Uncharacterized protein n=1 Tax=Aegilops tauschii TaxID=37682 RepID=M8BNZ5_AEGTA